MSNQNQGELKVCHFCKGNHAKDFVCREHWMLNYQGAMADCEEYERRIAALARELGEAHKTIDAIQDCEEAGWGGTLKDNILCHLKVLCDLDGKHWELNPKADAGHTRAVAHIAMRVIRRMIDAEGERDEAIGLLDEMDGATSYIDEPETGLWVTKPFPTEIVRRVRDILSKREGG